VLSLAALAAGLSGLPLALVRWGYWPVSGVPTWEQVADLPWTIVTDRALLGVLTMATWVVWAAFAITVVLELVAVVRGRASRNLPGCGGMQRWVRALITSLAMSAGATGSLPVLSFGGAAYAAPAQVVSPDLSVAGWLGGVWVREKALLVRETAFVEKRG
jgi:hypothetical protein